MRYGVSYKRILVLGLIAMSVIQAMIYTGIGPGVSYNAGLSPKSFYPIYLSLFVWQPGYTGSLAPISTPIQIALNSVYQTILIYAGEWAMWFSYAFVPVVIAAIGAFYLILEMLDSFYVGLHRKINHTLAFIFSLFLIFYSNYLTDYYILCMIPFVLLFAFKAFKENASGHGITAGTKIDAVISSSIFLAFTGYDVVPSISFFITIAIVLVALSRKGTRIALTKCIALVIAVALAVNTNFILNAYIAYTNFHAEYFNNYSINTGLYSNTAQLPYNLLGTNIAFPTGVFPLSSMLVFLLFLSGVYAAMSGIYKNKAKLDASAFAIALTIAWLASLFLFSSSSMPFGSIFSILVNHFSFLISVRSSSIQLFPFLIVPIVTMAAIGAAHVYETLGGYGSKTRTLLVIGLVILLVAYVYQNDIVNNSQAGVTMGATPQYVWNIVSYIDNQSGDYNIGTLPPSPSFMLTNWYRYGEDVYAELIPQHAVFTGGYAPSTPLIGEDIESAEYADYLAIPVSQKDVNTSISNLLGIFGIRYVIVQGDAKANGQILFSFNNIYTNLNNSKGIEFVGYFGNSNIYQNERYVPLVYSSRIYNAGNSNTADIFAMISNNSFNISSNSVYSRYINGFNTSSLLSVSINPLYSSNRTPQSVNATLPLPKLHYSQETPTLIKVDVVNATSPFYLVLRETYDTHWTAYYGNGTALNQSSHLAVNGFANAWYIAKKGKYTITLHYTLQSVAWASWLISVFSLILVGYLRILIFRNKTKKWVMGTHGV